jgi:hypothetical protein
MLHAMPTKSRKYLTLGEIVLKERPEISTDIFVLRVLLNVCRRPAVRFGLRRDPRGRFRDPQFVSFMAQSNNKPLNTDLHDAVLRGRKVMRNVFRFALAGGAAWVVLESAKALSVF